MSPSTRPVRVIFDANIYISYLLSPARLGTITALFGAVASGQVKLLVMKQLQEELVGKVSSKAFLAKRISRQDLESFMDFLEQFAELLPDIDNQAIASISRDPKDDYLLAYALLGQADYLVTGDQDLLVIGKVNGLQIVTPGEFLNILQQTGN